jgi:hypothetical protein
MPSTSRAWLAVAGAALAASCTSSAVAHRERFVVAAGATGQHGWDLLAGRPDGSGSRIGRLVADWITGRQG